VAPPERDDASREPDELDSLIDEFGDRSGPDPAREPGVEPEPDDDPGEDGEPDPEPPGAA
jgi:hypothetical protein